MSNDPPIDKTNKMEGGSQRDGGKVRRIEKQGHQLADRHKKVGETSKRKSLTAYLDQYKDLFETAVRIFRGATEEELSLSYSAEWMLDNAYLLRQVIRLIEEDLPPNFYRQLPKLVEGPSAGYPRVYELAKVLVETEDANIDVGVVRRFVRAYEAIQPLDIGELWAVPLMLRLAVIQCLAFSIASITDIPLEEKYPDLPVIDLSDQIPNDDVVANSFLSLRNLGAEDWKDFFEELSFVELLLNRDPAGVYPLMDFQTRDRCRKVIEELATRSSKDERAVAREALRLSQAALDRMRFVEGMYDNDSDGYGGGDEVWSGLRFPVESHVGYYLLDRGREELEQALGYQPPPTLVVRRFIYNHGSFVYLGGIFFLALFLVSGVIGYTLAAGGATWHVALAGVLSFIPSLTIAIQLVNWVTTVFLPPQVIPKMDFEDGLPAGTETAVVIPAILNKKEDVDSLLQQLELHFLRNPDPRLIFALLADTGDAPEQVLPEDEELVAHASSGIQVLNEKYSTEDHPAPFYFFYRERLWNEQEQVWMAWERKRGKLHEFNQLILGDAETSYKIKLGDLDRLKGILYVITLDADTILPQGNANRLVGAMSHPLSQPRLDDTGRVERGYTILQPRTVISPTSANRSLFSRIFSGDTGLDLYTLAVSDVYQDLFSEGIYVGKGIYDVAAFERSLENKIPENTLLSHDLFEGIQGRAGLASDIVLVEDYPPNYLVQVQRMHRWIRGDWQLIPWLMPRVPTASGRKAPNTFSAVDRWKLFDNMRRSLLSPALLFLFLVGWTVLPGNPATWTLFGLLSLGVPTFTAMFELIRSVVQAGGDVAPGLSSLRDTAVRWFLAMAFLPYEAIANLDAIVTTLNRLLITRRGLLEWVTAAEATRSFEDRWSPDLTWRNMAWALVYAASLVGLLVIVAPSSLPSSFLILVIWMFSPEIAYFISRPLQMVAEPLKREARLELRRLARRTWLFFEQFVGPQDQWLPPDHFQESPLGVTAHRTSPTNIGMYLLASLSAYDFGYIGLLDLTARWRTTFESMERLERYRGHLLNWYDTRSLTPLEPRYVSTVDSGNLAASLVVLRSACEELRKASLLRRASLEGLQDSIGLIIDITHELQEAGIEEAAELRKQLSVLQRKIADVLIEPLDWIPLLLFLSEEGWAGLRDRIYSLVGKEAQQLGTERLRRIRIFTNRAHDHLDRTLREVEMLAPWLLHLKEPPDILDDGSSGSPLGQAWLDLRLALAPTISLQEATVLPEKVENQVARLLSELDSANITGQEYQDVVAWMEGLRDQLNNGAMSAKVLMIAMEDLQLQSNEFFNAMDFGFLFDRERKVFHIGHNLSLGHLDQNYYDLLASEARIASLVAIARKDVPQSHWLHLARPLTVVSGVRALLSWSATMFEYLMPPLMVRSYEGTLLHQTSWAVVKHQVDYARSRGLPWGMSESGYYRFDANLFYQYRAFGVPGLGFKRGLGDDLVISPYASFLALSTSPHDVVENLLHLRDLGMMGAYGLYEAIDFTRERLPLGEKYAIVRSFMSHHQGMIFLALTNFFYDQVFVRRFHADPLIQSVELLLQEQIPRDAPLESPHREEGVAIRPEHARVTIYPWSVPVRTPQPRVHYLSNGRYGVLITNAGSGFSSWRDVGLTRWRADSTLDNWGSWIYVQDMENGECWSAAYQPLGGNDDAIQVHFHAHAAEYRRRDHDISLVTEITVAPEDDVEIRRVRVTNHRDYLRHLRLTSYGEVILAAQPSDRRHPAFNKLFIESQYIEDGNLLLFRRRPRSKDDEELFLAHALIPASDYPPTRARESDRAKFLGRGRTPKDPQALAGDGWLSGSEGATLDPIFSLGQELQIPPHGTAEVTFLTVAAESREQALALVRRYRSSTTVERAFMQAHNQAGVNLRRMGLEIPDLERIEKLLSLLYYPSPWLRAPAEVLSLNREGQSGLWPFGISGDYPILLVRLSTDKGLGLVQDALRAHAYWRERGLKIDLLILNDEGSGYAQELTGKIRRLIHRTNSDAWINRRGGIFLLQADQMERQERLLVETVARAILSEEDGALERQLQTLDDSPTRLPFFSPVQTSPDVEEESDEALARPIDLEFDNGYGGFARDGREYVIYLEPGQWTPLPWSNVIANPNFGFMFTEAGGGYTWAANSGENRLTPWSNDPVSDIPGEALYLRDEETGEIWSPTPLPARANAPYLIRHGAGYSIVEHRSHRLDQRMRVFAAIDDPVRIVQLRLKNRSQHTRRITVTYYAEWVLGVNRGDSQQFVISEFDGDRQALLAYNTYNAEFAQRVAFATASLSLHGITADRTEFFGRLGSLEKPAALQRIGLGSRIQPGLDPCAALQLHVDLHPGEEDEVWFVLGQGKDREHAMSLAGRYRQMGQVQSAWESMCEYWDEILGTVQVRTPMREMDIMLNRWLLYQALSCRIWGRSAFYQSSGAYGFRDQLQDVMALVHAAPQIVREHLLRSAAHQFEEGDVLHWWHPPSGRGVRTRITDDLLWLPFVTAHYVSSTGDESVLAEKEPFRDAPSLEPGEEERYGHYRLTNNLYSLYEHCRRAVEHGETSGPHQLPLIGTGDWNDGMNRVGNEGKGESVWLGWFLYATLERFADICDRMEHHQQAEVYRERARDLRSDIHNAAWDGEWYLRGYYDDGSPLGSKDNLECKIDSIAQSWAVLSGAGEPERDRLAMQSVYNHLIREEDGLLLLFKPPFDKTPRNPGYIKGYLPGIRENGGQYTHAAIWAVWAFAEMGRTDIAARLFQMLTPIAHSDTSEEAEKYRVEPYVVAADIYSVPPHAGRGGWTWYTGSSSWLYRLGVEGLLGVILEEGALRFEPNIPPDWSGYQIVYRKGRSRYFISVENRGGTGDGVREISLDGRILLDGLVPLMDDGRDHNVQVIMGNT